MLDHEVRVLRLAVRRQLSIINYLKHELEGIKTYINTGYSQNDAIISGIDQCIDTADTILNTIDYCDTADEQIIGELLC